MKKINKTNNLDSWRNEIDQIDSEILKLLSKRFSVVKDIGKFKKEFDIALLDEKRKEAIISSLIQKGKDLKISSNFIKEFYEVIHNHSVKIQKNNK